jgi:hypothetical protein
VFSATELIGYLGVAHNRSRDQLRKEGNVCRHIHEGFRLRGGTAIHVNDVGDDLENEEGDSNGKNDLRNPSQQLFAAGEHLKDAAERCDAEVEILEVPQKRQGAPYPPDQPGPFSAGGFTAGDLPSHHSGAGGRHHEEEEKIDAPPAVEEPASSENPAAPIAKGQQVVSKEEEREKKEEEGRAGKNHGVSPRLFRRHRSCLEEHPFPTDENTVGLTPLELQSPAEELVPALLYRQLDGNRVDSDGTGTSRWNGGEYRRSGLDGGKTHRLVSEIEENDLRPRGIPVGFVLDDCERPVGIGNDRVELARLREKLDAGGAPTDNVDPGRCGPVRSDLSGCNGSKAKRPDVHSRSGFARLKVDHPDEGGVSRN